MLHTAQPTLFLKRKVQHVQLAINTSILGRLSDLEDVTFSADGTHLAFVTDAPFSNPQLVVHHIQTGKTAAIQLPDEPDTLHFTLDGRFILLAHFCGAAAQRRAAQGAQVACWQFNCTGKQLKRSAQFYLDVPAALIGSFLTVHLAPGSQHVLLKGAFTTDKHGYLGDRSCLEACKGVIMATHNAASCFEMMLSLDDA